MRRGSVLALLTAVTLLLTGCVSWFLPPSATSNPTGEKVAADLAPYYHQVLHWSACGSGMQCTTAKAPLDWSNPSGASIKLALIRQQATSGHSLGSLLVNPGGPGASGYDFVRDSISYATSSTLQKNYDIVGFDPRGVNHSSAIKCYQSPKVLDSFLYDIPAGTPGSDGWIAELEKAQKDFGAECLKYTGSLLGQVGTISAARDLDLLRAALGDTKLNYLGYSYGTLLGATYANLYPSHTGHLVLDGAVDPTVTPFELSATQAQGFEHALRKFLAGCPKLTGCPFGSDVDQDMASIRGLLDRLDVSPLRAADGRKLGSAVMFTAIIYPLYNVDNWGALVDLFRSVAKGDPSYAFQLADGYNGRNKDGTYSDNSTEAFTAINCLDYPSDPTVSTMRADAAKLDKLAPVFGHLMAYGGTGCYDWPFKPTRVAGQITAAGSAPILVVGTTGDPATPYVWAKHVAAMLQNGHLVTYNGEGHTAYNKSNACVNQTVDNFFVHDTVPSSDPNC
nr:alpha/beta hydrolase [Galbitalea soli]